MPLARPRPVLAVLVAAALAAGALVFASTSSAASPSDQIAAEASRLGGKIGTPTDRYVTTQRYGRTVTYRWFSKGLLVHNGKAVKRVAGAMLRTYYDKGAVGGALGAPVGSKRCGLTGGGCLQRFQHGSIFRSSSAKKKVSVSGVSGERSELLAVAKSQRGYKEPGYRRNRYGKWVNGGRYSNRAWCSFFMSWVSSASGNGRAMPKSKSFPSFVKAVKKRGKTKRTPEVGDMAFYDYFADGTPSHVGIIVSVHDSYVTTIEGNIDTAGRSGRPRGVHQVNRARKDVLFYATPDL